jgi:hypothetical protein
MGTVSKGVRSEQPKGQGSLAKNTDRSPYLENEERSLGSRDRHLFMQIPKISEALILQNVDVVFCPRRYRLRR